MAGIVVSISANRDRILEVSVDEAAIRSYITNRLNDARSTFQAHMASGPSPSAPGTYPRDDGGRLSSSVDFTVGDREGTLETNVEYAKFLTGGTSRMAARKMLADVLEEVMAARPATEELAQILVIT